MQSKLKENTRMACHTNRASSIGYYTPELSGCLRRGVLARTKWEESELPDARTLLVFAEGRRQEAAVLEDMAKAGVQPIEQQGAFEWREYQLSGHLDAVIVVDAKAIPLEIKSCSPNIFGIIHGFDDLKKKPWLRAYMMQIQMYMLFKNIDKGVFVFKDKSSGALKQINCDLDYELAEFGIKACEAINKHVAENTLPDRVKDIEICRMCQFKSTCLPDIQFGTPLQIKDDPAFESRVARMLELEEQSAEYTKTREVVKEEAKASAVNGELNMMVGKFHITGKTDARKAFRMEVETI